MHLPRNLENLHINKVFGTLKVENVHAENVQIAKTICTCTMQNISAENNIVIHKNIGKYIVQQMDCGTVIVENNVGAFTFNGMMSCSEKMNENIGDVRVINYTKSV